MVDLFWLALAGLFGLALGSLLNVLISRVPIMADRKLRAEAYDLLNLELPSPPALNLFVPRSHCPICQTQIRAIHLVPVLSWLALRGKCATCKQPIPIRYPFVELTTTLVVVLSVALYGISLESAVLVSGIAMLIVLGTIDLEHGTLPNELTYPLLFLGLLGSVLLPSAQFLAAAGSAVIGAIAGYLSFWLLNHAFRLIRGRDAMGEGDFKLHAAIGAWVGWQLLPYVVAIAFALGTIYGIYELVRGRYSHDEGIRFGPFLAIAAVVVILLHEQLYGLIFLRF